MMTGLSIIDQRQRPSKVDSVDCAEDESIIKLDNETLRRQLKEQQYVIDEQTRLMEMSLNSNYYIPGPADEMEVLDDAFEITTADLAGRHEELERRAKQLETERRSFTEAAVKLGFERMALEVPWKAANRTSRTNGDSLSSKNKGYKKVNQNMRSQCQRR